MNPKVELCGVRVRDLDCKRETTHLRARPLDSVRTAAAHPRSTCASADLLARFEPAGVPAGPATGESTYFGAIQSL